MEHTNISQQIRGIRVSAATQPQIEMQRLREEAEAIKLLSAEIMDAYGLCRSAETDRPTKTP